MIRFVKALVADIFLIVLAIFVIGGLIFGGFKIGVKYSENKHFEQKILSEFTVTCPYCEKNINCKCVIGE